MAASRKNSTTKSPSKEGLTTYAMRLKNGSERRITVPTDWKVTFGPTVPFERKAASYNDGTWALRFYEKDKLRAIFCDVRDFRDTSIEVLEKRIQSKRQVVEKAAKYGGRSAVVEAKIETWVNPDEPEEQNEKDEQFLLEDFGED